MSLQISNFLIRRYEGLTVKVETVSPACLMSSMSIFYWRNSERERSRRGIDYDQKTSGRGGVGCLCHSSNYTVLLPRDVHLLVRWNQWYPDKHRNDILMFTKNIYSSGLPLKKFLTAMEGAKGRLSVAGKDSGFQTKVFAVIWGGFAKTVYLG